MKYFVLFFASLLSLSTALPHPLIQHENAALSINEESVSRLPKIKARNPQCGRYTCCTETGCQER
jgi:hypothetical protein